MRILVTGGAGFIGSHVTDRLIESGHDVYVLDNLSTGKIKNVNKKATFLPLDLCDAKIQSVFMAIKPQIIYHHAAQTDVQKSLQEPLYDCQVNILGTVNLLQACEAAGVQKIIYASSAALYGTPGYLPLDERHPPAPLSFYGISKYVAEEYIKGFHNLFAIDYTILRYANVYGPRQSAKGEGGVIAIFADRILQGRPPVIYGDGEQTRDFIYVGDVAAANIAALEKGSGRVLNISTNTPTSVKGLLGIFGNLLQQQEIKCRYEASRPGDILHSYLNNQPAVSVLGWQPQTALREGIIKTLEDAKFSANGETELLTIH